MLIMVFVLWHILAVGVYAIPGDAKDKFSNWTRKTFGNTVRPYILITSQWQQWNLFSPDPLRRVTKYIIEIEEEGRVHVLTTLEPGSIPWWRHATYFKFLGSLLEWHENKEQLIVRFLHAQCAKFDVDAGTSIRLVYNYYIIPKHETVVPVEWWRHFQPDMETWYGTTTTCPSSPV